MELTSVFKHSAAIQISNKISLLQRRAWNVLLANAFDDMGETDRFKIPMSELAKILNFDSKNTGYLKEILQALISTTVEWNILEKDRHKVWGMFTLLSGADIDDEGYCLYRYDPVLREYLHNPSMYARISLSLQNQFSSKYAFALFELFADYFQSQRGYGETPWISLETFRELMGLEKDEYKEFKDVNKHIIKKAIMEINAVSNLYIDLEEGVITNTVRRKVVSIKFIIRRNKNNLQQLCLPLLESESESEQQVLLNILIAEFAIPFALATQIVENNPEYIINQQLNEIRKQVELSGHILDKSDLAFKAFFPKSVTVGTSSDAASSMKSEIDYIEKRLREIGFHTFKKVRKQHSDQVLMDAFKELDFEIEKRKKTDEGIDNLGGWLRMRLPESGQPYQFSSLYKKHLEKEAARKRGKEKLQQEERERAELTKKQEEQRKAFNEKIDIKIAELKQNSDEWTALEKEALANARLKVSAPAQNKEIKHLAEARLKNLSLDDLKEIEMEAVQFAQSVLKDCNVDRNSPAFKTTVENQKLEVVKTKYLEEFNKELNSTPAYIYYQHNLSKQMKVEIRSLISHKYCI